MGVGGQLDDAARGPGVRLVRAYTGRTRFDASRWAHPRQRAWVLDCLNHGSQLQRVGRGRPFLRPSGIAALYAPGFRYHEWQEAGQEVDESYVMFQLDASACRAFRVLVGRAGFCHFADPHGIVAETLRKIGEGVFARRPGFHLRAHGLLCAALASLLESEPSGPRQRLVRGEGGAPGRGSLRARVEALVRARPAARLRVADLARHVGMSESTFAHAYPRLAGESPHRSILRLKIEAAKRLLFEDRLRVKETAERLGFSSEFHFSRAFKRLEGVAPRHYRPSLLRRQAVPPRSRRRGAARN